MSLLFCQPRGKGVYGTRSNNPVLKLNNLQSRSGENQQQGYMHIFEGAMIGIRNPRVHEYAIEDTPGEALEMLVLANHLMRMLTRSILA